VAAPSPRRAGRPAAAVRLPDPAAVDRRSPEAVATAALTALYSYDTAVDTGPADADRRALPWLSPRTATAVQDARPIASAGAEWTRWTRHRAIVTPVLGPSRGRPPRGHRDPRSPAVHRHPHPRGRGGWRGSTSQLVAFVVLTHGSTGWAVDQVLPQ
jgi:hypothetical protein